MDQNRIAMIAQFVRTDPTPITATNMTEVDGTLSSYAQEGGFDWARLHTEAAQNDPSVLPQGAPYWAGGLPLSMLGFWGAATRERLASDPQLPGPLLALMAGDPAAGVRDRVAANPATPADVRQALAPAPASPPSAPASSASAPEAAPIVPVVSPSTGGFGQPSAPEAPTQAIPLNAPSGFSQPSAPDAPTQGIPLSAPMGGFGQPSAPEPTQAFPVGGAAGGPGGPGSSFAQTNQAAADKASRNKLLTGAGIGAAAMLLLLGLLFGIGVSRAYTVKVVDQEAQEGPVSTKFTGEYDVAQKSARICGDKEDYLGCIRAHEAVYKTVCTLKLTSQGELECSTLKTFISSAKARYKTCGRGCRTKATGGLWGRPYLEPDPVTEEVPGEPLPEISHEVTCAFNLGPIKLGDCPN